MAFSAYTLPANQLRPNRWDVLSVLVVVAILFAFGWAGEQMRLPFHLGHQIHISLAPTALPAYAAQTTLRMLIALLCSFLFSFIVGTMAAKSERAGSLIIPLIDILQSVPILGYLSVTIVGFIRLFPHSMLGPECAVIFVVFTSQVWNMTLSFYQSLRTIPKELTEATQMYHLSAWQRFWRLEVPFAMPGLLSNAMISMSGGWFFIVAAESIPVANQNIMLPGIGSYIQSAINQHDITAIGYAIVAMFVVIVLYDQIIFRPLIAWSTKFYAMDSNEDEPQSWVLDLLGRTQLLRHVKTLWSHCKVAFIDTPIFRTRFKARRQHQFAEPKQHPLVTLLWCLFILGLCLTACYMIWLFVSPALTVEMVRHVTMLGFFTATKVFVLILICLVIWVPAGVWIGMRPKVANFAMPMAQFFAAFPANLFYPIFFYLIVHFQLNPEIWTAPLMILGTQWYILFNVIAGAAAIPKELRLAADNMQLKGLLRWKRFVLPAIFPHIVTGAITAAGGAWNASIVAEYIEWGHRSITAVGLGAFITENTLSGNFPAMTLGIVSMCLWVIGFNLLIWRPLYAYAEERFTLNC